MISATLSDDPTTLTQCQSFRLRNRGKPFKQVFGYLGMTFLLFIYVHLMFVVPPDRSYENVVTWNAAVEYRAQQIRQEHLEAKRVRREKREAAATSATSTSALSELGQMLSFLLTYLTCRIMLRSCLCNNQRELVGETVNETQERSGSRIRGIRLRLRSALATTDDNPLGLLDAWSQRLDRRTLNSQAEALRFLRAAEERVLQLEAQSARGATADEIAACPVRTVSADDDILSQREDGHVPQCDICLELYRVNDAIRTIPCFHTFHTRCIDVWLAQRGACPVCLHPV